MKRLLALIALLLAFVCPALAQDYPDGIYRGFYYDGGIEQIAIQFELKDGIFTSLIYRGVKYKDGDYMNEDASDAQKAILHQYRQLAEYLVGKDISAIDDLYSPYDIVEDLDAVTTATMKAGKLISALWDGLNRHPYKIVDTTKLPEAESYSDGVYRGSYMEDGGEQVALEFTLKDNHFTEINYLTLQYKDEDYLSSDAATAREKSAHSLNSCLTISSVRTFQASIGSICPVDCIGHRCFHRRNAPRSKGHFRHLGRTWAARLYHH